MTVRESSGASVTVALATTTRYTVMAAVPATSLTAGESVLALTDTNATTARSIRVLATGSAAPGAGAGNGGYDGRDGVRSDPATGLSWMSVRAYDPTLGRFLSRDPLGRAPLFLADNPYAYAGNNPVSNVDPGGQTFGRGMGAGSSSTRRPGGPTRVRTRSGFGQRTSGPQWLKVIASVLVATDTALNLAQLPYLLEHWNNTIRLSYLQRVLEKLLEHNHWAKSPARFLRRSADLSAAEGEVESLSKLGEVLTAVGFFVDWGASTLAFLLGRTRPDLSGILRTSVAIVAGFIHATLLTGVSVLGASFAASLVTTVLPGVGAMFAPFAAAVGGFVFGLLGAAFADRVVPIIIDRIMPYGGGVNIAVA